MWNQRIKRLAGRLYSSSNLYRKMRRFSAAITKRISPAFRVSSRTLSTAGASFGERERGEEARYFREEEEAKKRALRAQMEKRLELPDDHADKKELLELLGTPEKKDEGFIARWGLNDWKTAVPIGILIAVPALSNEFLILSEETQILGMFMMTCATGYSQAGSALAATLDERAAEIAKDLKTVDASLLSESTEITTATKQMVGLTAEVKAVHALVDDLAAAQAEILNNTAAHQYNEAMRKKVEAIIALESQVEHSVRNRMLNAVKADVRKTFASDKKSKDAALEQALAVLGGGKSSKMGNDVVGNAFKSSLASYRTAYAKQSPESDEIIVQLNKDIAATTVAPVVSAKGGNVYETNPIL